jgi:endonuclease YncB( thermonuclease family)
VYVDGALVNVVLVGEGLARIAVLDEDELHAELLRDLEAQAREKGLGMWAPEL